MTGIRVTFTSNLRPQIENEIFTWSNFIKCIFVVGAMIGTFYFLPTANFSSNFSNKIIS